MLNSRKNQQGISLYVVIVIVLLSMLLALWASRTALFNEMIVGNDADYQRAYEAAQAMIQDAELDIQRKKADGSSCAPTAVTDVCRNDVAITEMIDTGPLMASLIATLDVAGNPEKCRHGICLKRVGVQDFWNDATIMGNMIDGAAATQNNVGARYGQYTGAPANGNPILAKTGSKEGAWYWIEVMRFDKDKDAENMIEDVASETIKAPLLFRITAIARGLKPSTQVVLQSVVALPPITGETVAAPAAPAVP